MVLALFFVFAISQDSVPYKANEEFEIKLDYQFRARPTASPNIFMFDESSEEHAKRISNTPLPYLTLNLVILKATDQEVRIQGFKNGSQFFTKRGIKSGSQIAVDMGFTDDMKDRITPHEYTLMLTDKSKNETSKIVIFIGEDGSFLVNGEKRGKF